MRMRELKRQNSNLKLTVVVLAVALAVALFKLHDASVAQVQLYDSGFNACIEENNLYTRYQ